MMNRFSFLSCLFSFICFTVSAQKLPNTNLFVFDLEVKSDTAFLLSNPSYLSNFNPTGYNNQPHFIDEDLLYLTVQYPMDTSQTDIYALDLSEKTKTRITATTESEYSPTLIPLGSADAPAYFSSIRVENDRDRTQRLWQFPLDHANNGRPVLRSVTDVGYHCWLNPREVALFIVGEPHQLVIANVQKQAVTQITGNIGRCIQRTAKGGLVFIQKLSAKSWLLKEITNSNYRPKLITAALKGSEDFVVLADGTIIAGQGSKLYKFKKSRDISWVEIADLSEYDINNITRLATNLSGTKLAIVSK